MIKGMKPWHGFEIQILFLLAKLVTSYNLRFVLLYPAFCKHRHYLTVVTIHFISLKYYPNSTSLTGAAVDVQIFQSNWSAV
jgi:hypothetical protein